MTYDDDVKTILLSLASYQDSLLQNYRTIFISSQTILISIAALIASLSSSSVEIFVSVLFVIGVFLFILWFIICFSRGINISYFQLQLEKLENGDLSNNDKKKIWTSFMNWKSECPWQKIKLFTNSRYKPVMEFTRFSLGVVLPVAYLILWIIILYVTFKL